MKHRKRTLAGLLCLTLLLVLCLTACTGDVQDVSDLETALNKAAGEYLSDYAKNSLDGYVLNQETTRIDSVQNEDIVYTLKGVMGLSEESSGAARTADFTMKIEFINYAGMTSATFRMLEINVADPK